MDNHRCTLGGAVWINLVNTINKRLVDMLDDPASVLLWLQENHLLRDSDHLDLEDKEHFLPIVSTLRSLRDICLAVLSDVEQKGISPTNVKRLQDMADEVNVRLAVLSSAGRLELVNEGVTTGDHISYHVIASMIHTLQTVSKDRIRTCEHEDCILHFIDTSKSGKRRWCSMETCGNRHKAAEFYARKKQQE
ncbi:CGNR zinc finger domain-containing protein [Brevibacillus choshinensis]|uniref:CGNR zinc finger domain-containing protein n=1 Tax=Brevibacillus choshinensis TaxID=54911 RepID=UPI002E1ADE76|nr:CGNR zinc finger domain-containing protein [Brevibacillus choshinensis]MED4784932.1 CGNR zinc finger domain-containing protein [Brevibacillus choshinensis]